MVSLRWIHRVAALYGGLCLLMTAATGVLYATLKAWGGYAHHDLGVFLAWHQLSLVGLKSVYPPLLLATVVAQTVTGAVMTARRCRHVGWEAVTKINSIRSFHASTVVSVVGGALVLLMAVSGGMYRIEKSWLARKNEAAWWMDYHTGRAFFPNVFWPWFPFFVGCIVLSLAASGMYIHPRIKRLVRSFSGAK